MGKYYLRVNLCRPYSHESLHAIQWVTYVCASWWVLVFGDLTSSLESCKKRLFLGQWSIFCAGMERFCCLQSGARSFCLSAEVQNAPKSVMRGSLKGKEQEHGQSISRRGWEGCVFDKADTELQDCNSFKDIFYFSPLVTELTPMVFDITRMTWWDYRCLFLVASCLWYI